MDVLQKVTKWKQRLLDLGKRNRLLYFKPTKRTTLQLLTPTPEVLFDRLVRLGAAWDVFMPPEPQNGVAASVQSTVEAGQIDRDIQEIDTVASPEDAWRLGTNQVLTSQRGRSLEATLYNLRSKARLAVEEQGFNILFTAFGFLEWTESTDSHVPIVSPLVLVPVQLEAESILEPYRLAPYEEEVVLNPTLAFRLQADFGLTLPGLPDEEDWELEAYLARVEDLVKSRGWRVKREAHLSLFSFLKLNMYKDLETYGEEISAHPVVAALAGDHSKLPLPPDDLITAEELDRKVHPQETYQVLDADSSQQAAIEAVKRGLSFVLQGPPGTGKSQTITNMIAEGLAAGKRILFVSEKMAALDVVFRRLKSSGLEDFCLQLHSHKANKREVIDELGRTLNAAKVAISDRVDEQLHQLLEQREYLNSVVQELHAMRQPMGRSAYQVQGDLAKLEWAPDLSFPFPDARQKTPADLRRYDQLLQQLAATGERVGSDYFANPWQGCVAPAYTLELQHDIATHFGNLGQLLPRLQSLLSGQTDSLGLALPETAEQFQRVTDLLALAGESPAPPISWFVGEPLQPLVDMARRYQDLLARYHQLRRGLLERYRESVLTLQPVPLVKDLRERPRQIFARLRPEAFPGDLPAHRNALLPLLAGLVNGLAQVQELAPILATAVTLPAPTTLQETTDLLELANLVARDPRPVAGWFDPTALQGLQARAQEAATLYTLWQEEERLALARYDQDALNLDAAALLRRFRTDYGSLLRFLRPAYHRDMKTLRALLKDGGKLSHEQAIRGVTLLKSIQDRRSWAAEHQAELGRTLGDHWFFGRDTRWADLLQALDTTRQIAERYRPAQPPGGLMNLLLKSGSGIRDVLDKWQRASAAVHALAPLVGRLEECLRRDGSPLSAGQVTARPMVHLAAWATSIHGALQAFLGAYDEVQNHLSMGQRRTVMDTLQDLERLAEIQETEAAMQAHEEELRKAFGRFFYGTDTVWDEVLHALDWTGAMLEAFGPGRPSERFVQAVCMEPAAIGAARATAREAAVLLDEMDRTFAWVEGLFEPGSLHLACLPVAECQRWLSTRVEHSAALANWIDFRVSREECRKAGLQAFVDAALQRHIPPTDLKAAFYKHFWRLWLDAVHGQVPHLGNFRGPLHARHIDAFRELDRKQFKLAQARLQAKLSVQRPNPVAMATRGGEIATLQREAEKRRRQKPLRKLFAEIPTLLLVLKPCLLMSPLSVSQFLDPKKYKFDVVIFDEASQICSEDAVGAIFRGKQVVVVGDREQLPPTNFFGASVGDSGFDEDDDATEAYESILDECSGVLNRKSLQWHYRSRHEHLIAFSNAKIYKNLVTFPSPVEKTDHLGVEFIHVPHGIYERSTSRTNPREAQRVVELIFEHLRRSPNRSLGVVTFSEAQQSAIDAELRNRRKSNPDFEEFFRSDREEPFFLKNLENVQGDERDTIIFSVGYAKDAAGVLHMNFGPLSRQGGYRRLNVAITRAKYNVKLVSSILPHDIDLDRTQAEGVKMLRLYMEFAQHGPLALQRELRVSAELQFDSDFEEAVYNELILRGYKVRSQVGCSGYRIDLAVEDPERSGVFVLGIECDGAAYHSAKTARDRDRLREEVLRGFNWRLHRIWSTDWIRHRADEMKRLEEAIQEAMTDPTRVSPEYLDTVAQTAPIALVGGAEDSSEQLVVELPVEESEATNEPAVPHYEHADVGGFLRDNTRTWDAAFMGEVMAYVINAEGPLHQEDVCRRLAPFWGQERVSIQIRRNIIGLNHRYGGKWFQLRGDYFWPVDMQTPPVRNGNGLRPIQYVCLEERAEAMLLLVRQALGMSRDDLLAETARLLGYNRNGQQIRAALNEALSDMLETGRVELAGEIVREVRA